MRRDSACSDKAGSLPFACAIDAQVLSPRKSLRNPAFSSTILESFAGSLTFLAFPKADSISTILQSHIALGSKDLSLRALAQDKARQSTSTKNTKQAMRSFFRKVDSSKDYSASAEFMDCHAIATALARNDRENNAASKKVDSRQTTQKSSRKRLTLESTFTPQIQLEYKKLAQLLESIFSSQTDSPFLSSRALRQQGVAIHNKKVDSSKNYSASAEFMDCRADFQSARNDKKNAAILNEQPKDSRFSKETCEPTLAPLRWFCDEKPLLCKPRKEIRLAVYRHSAAQQSKVYRAKPNPPAKFN